MKAKARIKQPWQLDLETRYTDAEAQAVADAQIATHTADDDAHHARYTDTEAEAVADTQIATHNTNASAHGFDFSKVPIEITGARDDPEGALAALLTALADLGLIIDSTTAS